MRKNRVDYLLSLIYHHLPPTYHHLPPTYHHLPPIYHLFAFIYHYVHMQTSIFNVPDGSFKVEYGCINHELC